MPKLTIVLGKNAPKIAHKEPVPVSTLAIFYPEVYRGQSGAVVYPLHPDDYIPHTLRWIKEGKNVQLWTMSEYLVSWIAQAVGDNTIRYQDVEVRLYANDNKSFRRFGISRDGVLTDVGDGAWPYGWFMPNL